MAGRLERCHRCRLQLVVPPEARSFRCHVCHAVTVVQSHDPNFLANKQVKQAATWFKALISNISSSNNPYTSMAMNSPPQQYWYQLPPRQLPYPQVYGKKRALLCGINYRSRSYELKGSVNDVQCMKYLLCDKFGFSEDCILVLTEEERDPYHIPTKKNMRMAMQWLVMNSQPGDSLVFHYSGHGSRQINFSGEEADGYDETLCPLDYETEGMILDDEINATIVRPLQRAVKLHAIIDACHSGTVLDLPFLCRMSRTGFYQWEKHGTELNKGTNGGFAVAFSGCDDNQTSADTTALSGNTMTGAMTYCFIQAVNSEIGITYGRILNSMRSTIRDAATGIRVTGPIASFIRQVFGAGLKQEPQLSATEQFDVYRTPFFI
ncbi:hypothetical protein ACLOJK_013363 [Asimina triloba]